MYTAATSYNSFGPVAKRTREAQQRFLTQRVLEQDSLLRNCHAFLVGQRLSLADCDGYES